MPEDPGRSQGSGRAGPHGDQAWLRAMQPGLESVAPDLSNVVPHRGIEAGDPPVRIAVMQNPGLAHPSVPVPPHPRNSRELAGSTSPTPRSTHWARASRTSNSTRTSSTRPQCSRAGWPGTIHWATATNELITCQEESSEIFAASATELPLASSSATDAPSIRRTNVSARGDPAVNRPSYTAAKTRRSIAAASA